MVTASLKPCEFTLSGFLPKHIDFTVQQNGRQKLTCFNGFNESWLQRNSGCCIIQCFLVISWQMQTENKYCFISCCMDDNGKIIATLVLASVLHEIIQEQI